MLTTTTTTLLNLAESGRYAIGGFNIYNLEGVNAVVQAAEEAHSPALLQIHPAALQHGGDGLVALCLQVAKSASVPIGVHLDHSTDENTIQHVLDAGMPSVMADGSHLPYEENVAFVRHAVEKAKAVGAIVEGELGRISGSEDGLTVETIDARMTDPSQAQDFVDQTGISLLAVCIGNIHGKYPFPPKLDFERLQAISNAVDVPLVMHGASGLSENMIKHSIELGIRKFNINTEIRQAYLTTIQQTILANPDIDLLPLMTQAQSAMKQMIIEKMVLLGSVGKAK
jgi:tagatose 1,6-diphosphate aldolase GatY/KbaY